MPTWRSILNELSLARPTGLKELADHVATAPAADIEELAAVGAMHELPWVRQVVLSILSGRAPEHDAVRGLVGWLTHDYEDFVAFDAIRLAGELRLTEALRELFVIVGQASRRLHGTAGKPVGLGHAVVLQAITAILGTADPARIARAEAELFPGGLDLEAYEALPARDAVEVGGHTHVGMVAVSGAGPTAGGPPRSFDPTSLLFDWDDPATIGACDDFRIDVLPISNAEYDAFAFGSHAQSHKYCHPAELPDKVHVRNTLLDSRSGPEHPVTGVDWFDAYAYARALGKRLPTEAEWQRGGQGDDGRAFAWGDQFDERRTHCHPQPRTAGWEGVEGWRNDLLRMAETAPPTTTRPRGIEGSESPFGVRDMSGNVWEWTSSSFAGPPFSPLDCDRDALDVIYDQRSYVVIKGGTWSSLPEQTSVAFRGRDLALDRHFEIGFRCVCDCPL